MKNRLIQKSVAALLLTAGLVTAQAQTQSQVINSNWKDGAGVVEFPALTDSYFKNPAIIGVQQLNLLDTIDNGMNKEQVWRLIGNPHFREGLYGNRAWNYAFRFKQADGSYKVCQYQAQFDDKSEPEVKALYTNCPKAPAPIAAPARAPKIITLSADALFAFARAGTKDVSTKGFTEVRELGSKLNQAYSRIDSVIITGYTDFIGSEASNLALSRARANTIRTMLINFGVPGNVIQTQGKGEADPVVTCAPKMARQALVNCLTPNRRVTVQVTGQERVTETAR